MSATAETLAAPPVALKRPPVNKWLVTVSITFGTLMGTIDGSIVNVALPHIRGSVGATLQEITWIATAFALSNVIVMPLTAFLGRLFGQKRVYMFCLVLFVTASALCGTARSLGSLVAYRAIQGLGAGALQPTEQAILRQTFPLKEQGMAMAVFALAVMIGPAVGPTLGGYIVDHYSWPWIFYINLPVGALGLIMVYNFVHEDEEIRSQNHKLAEEQRRNVDWSGIALVSVGLAALQYFLEEGQQDDWFESRLITACFFVACATLIAFVIRELTARVPAVNLRLFKDPVFMSGTLIGALMFALLMSGMFLLPVYMQELLGFTAQQSGWVLMPRVLVMFVATPIVGRIYNSVSPRVVVGFGILTFTVGAYFMSHLTLESGAGDIIGAILIQGVGFSCLFVPLSTVALSSIPRHQMADATGINSLFRQIGGSIGLAVFATLLNTYATQARAALGSHITEVNPIVQNRLAMIQRGLEARGMAPPLAHGGAIGALYGNVMRESMMLSFEKVFLLAGILFIAVMPLLAFLKMPEEETNKKGGFAEAAAHMEM
jgi:MFS transporter, DHA2 family, multidrug resistance protein